LVLKTRVLHGAAAGTRIPVWTGAELVNVWHGQLHWDLGNVLRRLVASGIARGAELVDGFPAGAAGTLAPVRRRLGARARGRPAGFIAQLEAVEAMAWAPS
jgi:hypothetical protein